MNCPQPNEEKIQVPADWAQAMTQAGWLLPIDEGQVARMEQLLEGKAVPLPDYLADPKAVLNGKPANTGRALPLVAPRDAADAIARAARSGRKIPPEIEARMHRDRHQAQDDMDHGSDET